MEINEVLEDLRDLYEKRSKALASPEKEILTLEKAIALINSLSAEIERLQADNDALRQKVAGLEATATALWGCLDDIDTYSDMAKGDDKLYRSLVERRQNDRWKTGITTDGYSLQFNLPTTPQEMKE